MKNYTQYNYDELVQRMTDILRDAEGWGEGYQSSTGQTLIQLMADVTDNLHYMLERRTNENYLETAQLRSSVIARACELGYRYRRAVGNNGYITIKIADTEIDGVFVPVYAESDIIIPKHTKIVQDDDEYFTNKECVIAQGQNTVDVEVIQGSLVTLASQVDEDGTILIQDYEYIDNKSLSVHSNGVEYKDVTSDNADVNKRALSFLKPDEEYYDIKYSVDGMRVVFGDNTFGKRPDGDVTITYILVDETKDPVIGVGNVFEFDIPPVGLGGIEYEWWIENTTSIRGYQPPEDDNSLKQNAVTYHKSNGRAVTNDDYAFWVKRSNAANIVDAVAFGEEEIESLIYNINNVYITYLKDNGNDLTLDEHTNLRSYMNKVKTSQAHLVFRNAGKLYIQVNLSFRKGANTPIADTEAYDIVRRFLDRTFRLGSGSIGKSIQASDIIRDLYKETVGRDGIKHPVIDYAKIDLNGVSPFSVPSKTGKALIDIGTDYQPVQDHRFVLILDNLVCSIIVDETDTRTDILSKMRDKIIEVTPLDARVTVAGLAYDAFGNPLPLGVNPIVGETMLIGVETPYFGNNHLISGAAVGSTLVGVVLRADAIDVNHYYYSSRAGRRPYIPLRAGTTVSFTAPSDTVVNIYTRLIKDDPTTETLIVTLQPNEIYSNTFNDEHILIFEYENDSYDDRIALIQYPSFDGTALGLEVSSKDKASRFNVITSSGDLSDYTMVDYTIKLPVETMGDKKILEGSLKIAYQDGNVYLNDRGDGYFEHPITEELVSTGRIDYVNGEVTLPRDTPEGNYLLMFDQNEFNNFSVDGTTAMQLIQPKQSLNSDEISLSRIVVV